MQSCIVYCDWLFIHHLANEINLYIFCLRTSFSFHLFLLLITACMYILGTEEKMSDNEFSSEGRNPAERKKISNLYQGAAKYDSKFSQTWTKKYACIIADSASSSHFRCTVCNRCVSCKHQGLQDVEIHVQRKSHKDLEKIKSSTSSLLSSFVTQLPEVIR